MKYHYTTNSNAAPFFSDTCDGVVEADDPMKAIKKVVKEYTHPCGLFAAVIKEPSLKGENDGETLSSYLSAKANNQMNDIHFEKYELVNKK